jgi:hypothetical protein
MKTSFFVELAPLVLTSQTIIGQGKFPQEKSALPYGCEELNLRLGCNG